MFLWFVRVTCNTRSFLFQMGPIENIPGHDFPAHESVELRKIDRSRDLFGVQLEVSGDKIFHWKSTLRFDLWFIKCHCFYFIKIVGITHLSYIKVHFYRFWDSLWDLWPFLMENSPMRLKIRYRKCYKVHIDLIIERKMMTW